MLTTPRILVWIDMLSVSAGLLVTRTLGLGVSTTVTTTCRFTLLDILRGQRLNICLGLWTRMVVSTLSVWVCVVVCLLFVRR